MAAQVLTADLLADFSGGTIEIEDRRDKSHISGPIYDEYHGQVQAAQIDHVGGNTKLVVKLCSVRRYNSRRSLDWIKARFDPHPRWVEDDTTSYEVPMRGWHASYDQHQRRLQLWSPHRTVTLFARNAAL